MAYTERAVDIEKVWIVLQRTTTWYMGLCHGFDSVGSGKIGAFILFTQSWASGYNLPSQPCLDNS